MDLSGTVQSKLLSEFRQDYVHGNDGLPPTSPTAIYCAVPRRAACKSNTLGCTCQIRQHMFKVISLFKDKAANKQKNLDELFKTSFVEMRCVYRQLGMMLGVMEAFGLQSSAAVYVKSEVRKNAFETWSNQHDETALAREVTKYIGEIQRVFPASVLRGEMGKEVVELYINYLSSAKLADEMNCCFHDMMKSLGIKNPELAAMDRDMNSAPEEALEPEPCGPSTRLSLQTGLTALVERYCLPDGNLADLQKSDSYVNRIVNPRYQFFIDAELEKQNGHYCSAVYFDAIKAIAKAILDPLATIYENTGKEFTSVSSLKAVLVLEKIAEDVFCAALQGKANLKVALQAVLESVHFKDTKWMLLKMLTDLFLCLVRARQDLRTWFLSVNAFAAIRVDEKRKSLVEAYATALGRGCYDKTSLEHLLMQVHSTVPIWDILLRCTELYYTDDQIEQSNRKIEAGFHHHFAKELAENCPELIRGRPIKTNRLCDIYMDIVKKRRALDAEYRSIREAEGVTIKMRIALGISTTLPNGLALNVSAKKRALRALGSVRDSDMPPSIERLKDLYTCPFDDTCETSTLCGHIVPALLSTAQNCADPGPFQKLLEEAGRLQARTGVKAADSAKNVGQRGDKGHGNVSYEPVSDRPLKISVEDGSTTETRFILQRLII